VSTSLTWFENLIDVVPRRFSGAGRRVYPGFLQAAAFMSMNLARHVDALTDCYQCRVQGDAAKAEAIGAFYTDYLATMDCRPRFTWTP
jgi:poly(3-hydroxybutyrate) depolymerase